jgi:hypothetical protein
MPKKLVAISSSLALLLLMAFAVQRNTISKPTQPEPRTSSPQQTHAVPDHVIYNALFRKVARLREKTKEQQALGRIGKRPYFPFKKEAGLNEDQATALESVAFACQQRVAVQDQKAKIIITAFQAQFPGGKVPQSGSPPPPPELKVMWEERNAIILRARDQLRAVFGEEEFGRFEKYARFHYGSNQKPDSN